MSRRLWRIRCVQGDIVIGNKCLLQEFWRGALQRYHSVALIVSTAPRLRCTTRKRAGQYTAVSRGALKEEEVRSSKNAAN